MCGRVTTLNFEELSEVLESIARRKRLRPLVERFERVDARPGSIVDTIAPSGGNGLAIESLKWGFDAPDGKWLTFNTRIESALGGSRMWAGPIQNGRCILPVASFYETHARTKKPYEFVTEDGTPLLLASVQERGRLSVVTTEPNEAVSPVHPRMPLTLQLEEAQAWLNGEFDSLADRSGFALNVIAPSNAKESDTQLSLF